MRADLSLPAPFAGTPSSSGPLAPQAPDTAKARDAAQQFEALLLAQLLRSVRESSGWGQSDAAGDCATEFAEQQFARVLAQQGGLGLAALIASGLERDRGSTAEAKPGQPEKR